MKNISDKVSQELNNPWDVVRHLRHSVKLLNCSIESKEHEIRLLKEQVDYLLRRRVGCKFEQTDIRQGSFDFGKFHPELSLPVEEINVPSHKRNKGGRRKPPAHLERVRIEHTLPEEQSNCCACGKKLRVQGEEVSERYNVEPARFWVEEHVRYVYGC